MSTTVNNPTIPDTSDLENLEGFDFTLDSLIIEEQNADKSDNNDDSKDDKKPKKEEPKNVKETDDTDSLKNKNKSKDSKNDNKEKEEEDKEDEEKNNKDENEDENEEEYEDATVKELTKEEKSALNQTVNFLHILATEELSLDIKKEDIKEYIKGSKTPKEALSSFIIQAIKENTEEPEFANEEIKQLNEFVTKGGDLKSYFESVYKEIDYEKIKLDSLTEIQKEEIIRNHLKSTTKFSEEKINKQIKIFKETEDFEKEVELALKDLKEEQKQKKENLIKTQEKIEKENIEKSKQSLENLKKSIKETDELAGFKLSDKEKTQFIDYLTKVNPKTGLTPYQEKIKSVPNLNIQLAFLAFKNVDAKNLETKQNTKVSKNLEKILNETSKKEGAGKGKNSSTSDKNLNKPEDDLAIFASVETLLGEINPS